MFRYIFFSCMKFTCRSCSRVQSRGLPENEQDKMLVRVAYTITKNLNLDTCPIINLILFTSSDLIFTHDFRTFLVRALQLIFEASVHQIRHRGGLINRLWAFFGWKKRVVWVEKWKTHSAKLKSCLRVATVFFCFPPLSLGFAVSLWLFAV